MKKRIIKNGVIYDGLGSKPFPGTIYIENDKISKIIKHSSADHPFPVDEYDAEIIDAAGKAVTPGFIDIHRHCDISPFFGTDFGKVLLAQGITTTVVGNCGFSMAPAPADDVSAEEMFNFAEPVVGPAAGKLSSFEEYLNCLDQLKLPINFVSLIGTGTVKIAVKGFSNDAFTAEELKKASDLIENAMKAGAAGASTGIMYLPECYNTTDEFVQMLKPLARYDGILCAHIRGEGDSLTDSIREIIKIGEKAGCPVEISHFKSCGMKNWRKEIHKAIELIENARKEGQDVTCDFYPYEGGSTSLTTMIPPVFVNGDMKHALAKLGTQTGVEEFCKSAERTYEDWDNYAITLGWDRILISGLNKSENQIFIGKTIAEASKECGCKNPAAFAARLMHDEDGKVAIINMSMCQEDIDTVAKLPYSNIISDSIYAATDTPHPRLYGTFPKIIREYVNERHLFTLEEAIRKMTGLPASRMGIEKRGVLLEGYYADINIFDPNELKDHATFQAPAQLSTGIYKCFVNGTLVWENETMCRDDCGRNLRKSQTPEIEARK